MGDAEKLLLRLLGGNADATIPFEPPCSLLRRLGFEERVRAGHHIFSRDGVAEIVNL